MKKFLLIPALLAASALTSFAAGKTIEVSAVTQTPAPHAITACHSVKQVQPNTLLSQSIWGDWRAFVGFFSS